MFIKSSKIFLPTCLFRPTCRVELDILLCKSTKKYPIIKFWMAFEQNWYPQLILCVLSNIRRFKVVQVIPTIITFHQTCLFHFQKYSHQHVYSIHHDNWIRFHVPSNMFIQSNMPIRNTRVHTSLESPKQFWLKVALKIRITLFIVCKIWL